MGGKMMYIPSSRDLTILKSIFDLSVKVFHYLSQPRAQSPQKIRDSAVISTLSEWEDLLISVQPRMAKEIFKLRGLPYLERSRQLENLADHYSQLPATVPPSVPEFLHTKVLSAPGGDTLIYFGESRETESLKGEVLVLSRNLGSWEPANFSGGSMIPPAFKVTMLGDSGSGKTVFMSSMYARLREGHRGIAIKAINDNVDLELGDTMERLYLYNKWPPGTDLSQKKYDFELLVSGHTVARVDWVDYRGGALLEEPESEGGKALAQRLHESHAIIWMVDMTRLTSTKVDGMKERIQTRVARMAAICRHAVEDADQPRAWIFVRTKGDTVRGLDGKPDWQKACSDLLQHLGPTTEVATSGRNSRAAALPISSVGRLSSAGDQLVGDDPSFVEWPLLLSLGFLAQAELDRLRVDQYKFRVEKDAKKPNSIESFIRDFLNLGPREEEIAAIQRLDTLSQRLLGIHATIGRLLQGCPGAVRLIPPMS